MERKFFIYENWTAESKAVIHRAECSFCNSGRGIHPNRIEGRNGRWHGPFATYSEAFRVAQALGNRGRHIWGCNFCNPAMNEETEEQEDEPRISGEEIDFWKREASREAAQREEALWHLKKDLEDFFGRLGG